MKAKDIQTAPELAMIALCFAALHGGMADTKRLQTVNLEELYTFSNIHAVEALVSEGLELAKGQEPSLFESEEDKVWLARFRERKELSVRKNILLDIERNKLFAFMEKQGIWYLPLKGILLKDMYPKLGLRQMSDNDILFDEAKRSEIHDWFVGNDYTVISYKKDIHDEYQKKPVINFEMHVKLYDIAEDPVFEDYYKDVKTRLKPDANKDYGFHFTDEDFYLHVIYHAYMHEKNGGTGIRILMDLAVYLSKKQDSMDWNYIEKELRHLGNEISDMEAACRSLALKLDKEAWYDCCMLSKEESNMLDELLFAGAYGNYAKLIAGRMEEKSKARYYMERLFPNYRFMHEHYPKMAGTKLLLPLAWIYRLIKKGLLHPGRPWKEWKESRKGK